MFSALKRLVIVGMLSSAARMPLPGSTIFAIVARSSVSLLIIHSCVGLYDGVSLPRLAHRVRGRNVEPDAHATLPSVAARLPLFVSRSFESSPLRNAAFRNFYFGSIGAALGYT